MFKLMLGGTFFIVIILGIFVYQDIKEKQHKELQLLIQDAKYTIDKIEKNKNYYAPKKESVPESHSK